MYANEFTCIGYEWIVASPSVVRRVDDASTVVYSVSQKK